MARATYALKEGGNAPGRAEQTGQVNSADIDAEFE